MPKTLQQDERAILRTEKLLATLKFDLTSNTILEQGEEREIFNSSELEESKLAFGKQIESLYSALPNTQPPQNNSFTELLPYLPKLAAELAKIKSFYFSHLEAKDKEIAALQTLQTELTSTKEQLDQCLTRESEFNTTPFDKTQQPSKQEEEFLDLLEEQVEPQVEESTSEVQSPPNRDSDTPDSDNCCGKEPCGCPPKPTEELPEGFKWQSVDVFGVIIWEKVSINPEPEPEPVDYMCPKCNCPFCICDEIVVAPPIPVEVKEEDLIADPLTTLLVLAPEKVSSIQVKTYKDKYGKILQSANPKLQLKIANSLNLKYTVGLILAKTHKGLLNDLGLKFPVSRLVSRTNEVLSEPPEAIEKAYKFLLENIPQNLLPGKEWSSIAESDPDKTKIQVNRLRQFHKTYGFYHKSD